jgi:hypothetical protein
LKAAVTAEEEEASVKTAGYLLLIVAPWYKANRHAVQVYSSTSFAETWIAHHSQ